MHGDHHAGLANLLRHRVQVRPSCYTLRLQLIKIFFMQNQSAQPSRLVIICPPHCKTYLYDLSQHQDLGLEHVDFVDTNSILRRKDLDQKGIKDLLQRHSLTNISTTLVDHRARCFGLAVQSASGWKVVYAYFSYQFRNALLTGLEQLFRRHQAVSGIGSPR